MEIDLYEYKTTLKKLENDDFIEIAENKGVAVIEVGKTKKEIDKKLMAKGYKKGERVLVIIQ